MMTPQEVSQPTFTKAPFGGYNMAKVDDYVDHVAADYAMLYKENKALKTKLKIMVDKVEEYRETEDSMRATLLMAQRQADTMIKEAEEQREAILTQAKGQIQEQINACQAELVEVEERLRIGRQELERFIHASHDIFSQGLQFLDQLPQLHPEAPEPEEEKTREIEESVMGAYNDNEAQQVSNEVDEISAAPSSLPPEGTIAMSTPPSSPPPEGTIAMSAAPSSPPPEGTIAMSTAPFSSPLEGTMKMSTTPLSSDSLNSNINTQEQDLRATRRFTGLTELSFSRNLSSNS